MCSDWTIRSKYPPLFTFWHSCVTVCAPFFQIQGIFHYFRTFKTEILHIYSLTGQILKQLSPSLSVTSIRYLPRSSVNIHRYSPPLWGIIVKYTQGANQGFCLACKFSFLLLGRQRTIINRSLNQSTKLGFESVCVWFRIHI